MRKRVVEHYRNMRFGMPEYTPVRMAELAEGIIAVEDKSGECDALFDKNKWGFSDPELWGVDPEDENSTLNALGLDILEGFGRSPKVRSINSMFIFAKAELSPKEGQKWHEEPKYFNFKL